MKKFINVDPNTIENDSRVALKFTEFAEELGRDRFYFLLKDKNYFIWVIKTFSPAYDTHPAEWGSEILLEFPISGLPWFINTIEQRFFKTGADGGLEKGKFSHEEEIAGERLCISRMFGEPGYGFRNCSRNDYVHTTYDSPQEADFSDELLFQKGLFDEFKIISEKLSMGKL